MRTLFGSDPPCPPPPPPAGPPHPGDLLTEVRQAVALDGLAVPTTPGRPVWVRFPWDVAHDAIQEAEARGTLRSPRHVGFPEEILALGLAWVDLLVAQVGLAPCRLLVIREGALRGVWLLPLRGDDAWLGVREGESDEPLVWPEAADVAVAYARADRSVALRLGAAVASAGLVPHLVDLDAAVHGPVGWAHLRAVLRGTRRFTPIFSPHLPAESFAGVCAACAGLRARSDVLQWGACVPGWVGTPSPCQAGPDGGDDPSCQLPGFSLDTADGLSRCVCLLRALSAADDGEPEDLLRFVEHSAQRGEDQRTDGVVDWWWPLRDGRRARVRVAGMLVRVLQQDPDRFVPTPAPRGEAAAPADPGLSMALRQGHAIEVARIVATSQWTRGVDVGGLVLLGLALTDRGRLGDACVVLGEARRLLSPSDGPDTTARLTAASLRVGWLAPFVAGRSVGGVLDACRYLGPRPPEVVAALPAGACEQAGSRSLEANGAHVRLLLEAGRHGEAESLALLGFSRSAHDAGRAGFLALAAIAATRRGDGARALQYAAVALDYDPEAPLALQVLGERVSATTRAPAPVPAPAGVREQDQHR